METKYKALLALIIISLLAISASMDYKDKILLEKHFCNNVADGIWPDPDDRCL